MDVYYIIFLSLKIGVWKMDLFLEILKNIDWTKIVLAIISLFCLGFVINISIKKIKQKQITGNNSTNYQAGNDVTVINNGLNIEHVKELIKTEGKDILLQLFFDNFLIMQNTAKEAVNERVKDLTNEFNEKLLSQEEQVIIKVHERLSEPDMQSAFFEAQKGYAKTGDKNKEDLLTDLLLNKGKEEQGTLKDLLLDEAIETIPKLTKQQIDLLGLLVIKDSLFNVINKETFKQLLIDTYLPFVSCLPMSVQNLDYLNQVNCISFLSFRKQDNTFIEQFKKNYKGIFSKGFNREDIEKELNMEKYSNLFIPCLNNNNLYQINALNEDILDEQISKIENVDINEIVIIKKYFMMILSDEEIKQILTDLVPEMQKIIEVGMIPDNLRINPLGILIGIMNIKSKTRKNMNWDF